MLPVGLPLATAPFVLFARWAAAILAFTTFDTFEFVVGEIGVAVVVSDVPSSIAGATGQVRQGRCGKGRCGKGRCRGRKSLTWAHGSERASWRRVVT